MYGVADYGGGWYGNSSWSSSFLIMEEFVANLVFWFCGMA